MAKDTIVTGSKLTAIANAIRTRGGTQAQLTLDAMPQAVADIPGGGGGGGFDWSQCSGVSFYNYKLKVTNPDFTGLDTTGFTDMSYMFSNCTTPTALDLYQFDTSDVTSMRSMFGSCSNLASVNLASFDTTQVSDMASMFYRCLKLYFIIWSQADSVMPICTTPSSMNIGSNQTFYVPDALVNDYKAATNWSAISSQIRPISALPANIAAIYEGHY